MEEKIVNKPLGGAILTPHKGRYDALDGLRALACIGIVLMHVLENIVIKPSDCFLTTNVISFAGDFVLLFMMVSAFGLCCGYYNKFREGTFKPDVFYRKRYQRVLPFFTLLTTIDVIICFALEHFKLSDTFLGELCEAFANCTLAFGLIPSHHNIEVVGVGWFLGVIFLFYMLFPFFIFLMENKKRAWFSTFVVVGLYMSVMYYFAPTKGVVFCNASFIYSAPFFMVGGMVYLYRETITNMLSITWAKLAVTAVTIGYTTWFFVYPEQRFELANIVLYSLWLSYAIGEVTTNRKWTILNNRIVVFISEISMEIYLSHMFVFRAVEKCHIEKYVNNNDIYYWLTCVMVLLGAMFFSIAWKRIEKSYILNK